jgi:hypothetical protein
MHWKAPAFVHKVEGNHGPILMMVEYKIDPKESAPFLALMQEIGSERKRDGAYAWNVFDDPNQPGRIIETSLVHSLLELGSGLTNYSQKMTAAAMQIAEKKVWAQRSNRVWTRLQSLSRPNMFSILWRCL